MAQFFIELSGLMCLFNFDFFYVFTRRFFLSAQPRGDVGRMKPIVFIFNESVNGWEVLNEIPER